MPRAAAKKQTLATLTGDMSDDDELAYTQFGKTGASEMPTPDTAAENKTAKTTIKSTAAAARKRAPARANHVAKAKTAPEKEAAGKARGKRAALEDVTNTEPAESLEPSRKRAKTSQTATNPKARKGQTQGPVGLEDARGHQEEHAQVAEDVSESIEQVSPTLQVESRRPPPVAPRAQSQSRPPIRANSRALSIERGVGDAALRRRVGELTSKCESLELKYSQLKEAASVEGQSSFDKLKSSIDKHSKSQDNLIASLRKQLAAQTELANEVRTLRVQLATSQQESDKLRTDKSAQATETKTAKEAAAKAHNEIKALQAKLAASRANAEPAHAKGRGSVSAAAAAGSGALASLKEDLYCDVTGLLVHSVKRTDRRTVYDCSQTGRNGTLRFQFTIDELDLSTMTPGASVFDDAQVTYTPLIDERNDQQLYDILADYLLEEIEFPRSSLMKLYTSIRDGMTKAVVLQDDDEDDSQEGE